MVKNNLAILQTLRHPTKLFSASKKSVSTGYSKAWLRDNIYTLLGLEASGRIEDAVSTIHAILDILTKHEYKIDWAIKEKPTHAYQYIHARYDPATLDEFPEEWGNKQNDAIGAILFKIGDLERKGVRVLRGEKDKEIMQKLVHYLETIEYWHDPDNGMWEEGEEVHASSVGACVAGLHAVSHLTRVPSELIQKGVDQLNSLLPRESSSKSVDLALLSLIYPYNIVDQKIRDSILSNVEKKLVRQRGLIRYPGDTYYSTASGEAEWTMGFAWLAVIYKTIGKQERYVWYLALAESVMNEAGELPELYYAGEARHNENTPLAWAHSMMMVAKASH